MGLKNVSYFYSTIIAEDYNNKMSQQMAYGLLNRVKSYMHKIAQYLFFTGILLFAKQINLLAEIK